MNKYETRWGERHIQLLQLKKLIKKKYRTLETFAYAIDTSPPQLSRVLSGHERVEPSELKIWAAKLKISEKQLVNYLGGAD